LRIRQGDAGAQVQCLGKGQAAVHLPLSVSYKLIAPIYHA
jgi:hypothetical protein